MYKSKSLGKIHSTNQIMQGILKLSVSQTYGTSALLVRSKLSLSIWHLWNTDEGCVGLSGYTQKIYEITQITLRALTRLSSE